MDMQLIETEKMGERNPVSEVESRFTLGNNEFKLLADCMVMNIEHMENSHLQLRERFSLKQTHSDYLKGLNPGGSGSYLGRHYR